MPNSSEIRLQLDMEQARTGKNTITRIDSLDQFGRKRIRLDWTVSNEDEKRFLETSARYIATWNASARLPPLEQIHEQELSSKLFDAYHPVGSCSMGEGSESVVSLDSAVQGFRNLWIAGTAVLPSAGTANPTFTALCLAESLIKKSLGPV